MSVKYRKRKIVLQFDKENPVSKYVATNVTVGSIGYNKLCDEVNQRIGMHRGIVDVVLKGVQDTMVSFLEEGFSVKRESSEHSVLPFKPKVRIKKKTWIRGRYPE